jgi:hypothetical protein
MLLGKSQDKLRLNPRKAWYRNLEDVVPEGDRAVTFVLKRSQPAFLMLLASRPLDAIEVRPSRLPVVRVPDHPDVFVRLESGEFEGPRADRVSAHVARRNVARIDWRHAASSRTVSCIARRMSESLNGGRPRPSRLSPASST